MPVAFNSVVASSLYELDLDLANSCWLMTTGAMVIVLPCLYFLLEHI
jgi:predicted permease